MTLRVLKLRGNIQLIFFTCVLLLFFVRQCTLCPTNNSRLYELSPSFHKSAVNYVF